MYELIRCLTLRQIAIEQLPSFLLETGAFLLTWLVLDALHATLRGMFAAQGKGKFK